MNRNEVEASLKKKKGKVLSDESQSLSHAKSPGTNKNPFFCLVDTLLRHIYRQNQVVVHVNITCGTCNVYM